MLYSVCFCRFLKTQMDALQPLLQAKLPERIVHGDLFLENTLFENDEKFVAVLDFEVCD
jgi:Ser/Thr protein kinase RdoA (MazF antagonist)